MAVERKFFQPPAGHFFLFGPRGTGKSTWLRAASARKLKRAGVDLLAGRAVVRSMHPFVAAELGARFDLPAALDHGLLPLVWDAADRAETLSAYVGT